MESMQTHVRDIVAPRKLQEMGRQIGNTPLEAVSFVIQGAVHRVHLKLEGCNPTGSMKDRTGYALMRQLADQGRLRPDSVIVESTSGNLGVALASICQANHYRFIAVVDPKTTGENLQRLRAFGTHIDMVQQPDETGGYLLSRLARISALCQEHPAYLWTNQYANPANPDIHYRSTGPEIYHQMSGRVDAVFVPVSTGGTLAGIGRYFREVSPATHIIGVDAYGSVVFGERPAPRKLTGIGSSRTSCFISRDVYDTHILVRDEEAFAFCRALAAMTGLKVGGSSGAALAACGRYLQEHPNLERVVCVCADNGENYASSIFSDDWLARQGLSLSRLHLGAVEEITHMYSRIF